MPSTITVEQLQAEYQAQREEEDHRQLEEDGLFEKELARQAEEEWR
jgi:hypothetical protein